MCVEHIKVTLTNLLKTETCGCRWDDVSRRWNGWSALALPQFSSTIYFIVCSESENSCRLQLRVQVTILGPRLTRTTPLTDGTLNSKIDCWGLFHTCSALVFAQRASPPSQVAPKCNQTFCTIHVITGKLFFIFLELCNGSGVH